MVLTAKQEIGLKIALDRYKSGERYTTIAGYAGTGKSTLVKFIINALLNMDITEDDVIYATYTGKAAEVLRKKGNTNAFTLHKILYKNVPQKNGTWLRVPNPDIPGRVIVVDEVSMVPKKMIDLLLKHQVYIIFLGDPFQLPQIEKGEENGILEKPHIFLDEIMRQAAESEIIRFTLGIREGRDLPHNFKGKEVQIFPTGTLNTGMCNWADQILCATNKTRTGINQQMRKLKGFDGLVAEGEKVIIKENYWGIFNSHEDPIVNGSIGTFHNGTESFKMLPSNCKYYSRNKTIPVIVGTFRPEGVENGDYNSVEFDKHFITTEKSCLPWELEWKVRKANPDFMPVKMTYGYAITVHCAQGSEWNNVLVVEERFPFEKGEHARWLYTAATRASQRLLLVRGQ